MSLVSLSYDRWTYVRSFQNVGQNSKIVVTIQIKPRKQQI